MVSDFQNLYMGLTEEMIAKAGCMPPPGGTPAQRAVYVRRCMATKKAAEENDEITPAESARSVTGRATDVGQPKTEPEGPPKTAIAAGKYVVPTGRGDTAIVTQLDSNTRLVQRTAVAGPVAVEVEHPPWVPITVTVQEVADPEGDVTGDVINPAALAIQRATAEGQEIEIPKVPDVGIFRDVWNRLSSVDWTGYLPSIGIGLGIFRAIRGG